MEQNNFFVFTCRASRKSPPSHLSRSRRYHPESIESSGVHGLKRDSVTRCQVYSSNMASPPRPRTFDRPRKLSLAENYEFAEVYIAWALSLTVRKYNFWLQQIAAIWHNPLFCGADIRSYLLRNCGVKLSSIENSLFRENFDIIDELAKANSKII